MEGGSGPRGGVHNKQMFILSGFIISDPDCNKIKRLGPMHAQNTFTILEQSVHRSWILCKLTSELNFES